MTAKTMKPGKAKPRPAPVSQLKKREKPAEARPPESAEDFEHTLRRLVAARDKLSHSG